LRLSEEILLIRLTIGIKSIYWKVSAVLQ
jgi:hypothetical protein